MRSRKNKRVKNRRTLVRGGSVSEHLSKKIKEVYDAIIIFFESLGQQVSKVQKMELFSSIKRWFRKNPNSTDAEAIDVLLNQNTSHDFDRNQLFNTLKRQRFFGNPDW